KLGGASECPLPNSVARETTPVVAPPAKGWVWEGRTPVPPPNSIVRPCWQRLLCRPRALRVMPPKPILRHELVGLARPPRPSFVNRQRAHRVASPYFQHRIENLPRHLDPVAAGEQGRIAMDHVEQESLVGFGRLAAEHLAVLEVELDDAEPEVGARNLAF